MPINILIYILVSFLIIFLSAKSSYKLNLVDLPNKRKMHSSPTAFTGGLAISLSYLFALQLFDGTGENLNLIISMAFLITIIGFIDDLYQLNFGGKLSLQIIPIFYLIVIENLKLTNIGDYDYFVINLGAFAIPFSLLCSLLLINSFNYFDGMDGTLVFSTISVIFILLFLNDDFEIKFYLMLIIIPLVIFLFFNFSIFKMPKLFLGDGGSLLIGFIISFSLIYFAKIKIAHPILLAWSVSIFVYEFLSINIIRLKRNKNLFEPGKDHLHHVLFKKYNSILFVNLFIFLLNILFFIMGYLSYYLYKPLSSLILFLLFFFTYFIFRDKYASKKK